MRRLPCSAISTLWALSGICFLIAAGCAKKGMTVTNPYGGASYPLDNPKPLPDQSAQNGPQPTYGDPPIIDQPTPEQTWFVNAYNQVGRPRLAVFVNRTLQGYVISSPSDGSYLAPGEYQPSDFSLDYSEIESLLSDWFSARGQVTLVSPEFIRTHMTQEQVQNLQAGKSQSLNDVGQSTGADVLIQVQARPARRNGQLVVVLIGEAVNVRGGESIGHVIVEMPAPLDRIELNNYTRFVARKIMEDMVNAWTNAPPPGQSSPSTRP